MAITINGNGTLTGVSVGGLPDGIVDTDMLAASAVTAAKSSGLGITMVEQWEVSDEVSVGSAQTYTLTGTWAKRNQNGSGTIGASGMSVSSGVFTFPSTGIYKIDFTANVRHSQGTGRRRVAGIINTTHDNSTYIEAYYGGTNLSNRGSTTSGSDTCQLIFDVQNTSNYKIKFSINFSNDGKINARDSGTPTKTNVIFTKLGDT